MMKNYLWNDWVKIKRRWLVFLRCNNKCFNGNALIKGWGINIVIPFFQFLFHAYFELMRYFNLHWGRVHYGNKIKLHQWIEFSSAFFKWPIDVSNTFNLEQSTKPNLSRVINWLILLGNFLNSWHHDKLSCSSAINWPRDVGNSFNWLQYDKLRSQRLFNWPIDVGSSFNLKHINKSKCWRLINWPMDVGNSVNFEHPNK